MKKIINVFLSILLLLSISSCKKEDNNNNANTINEQETIEDTSFVAQLEKQVEDGTISKDDYINNTLLGVFDSSYIYEEYKDENIDISDVRPFIEYAQEHIDELSDETKTAIVEALTLSFISFETEEKQTGFVDRLIDDFFVDVNALTKDVLIRDVLQSDSGRFNIWYSDGDPNSATKAQAKMVADTLDEAADLYDAYFNTTFQYMKEAVYSGATTNAQEYILMANGYQAVDLLTCMNVYLCDFTDSDTSAICCSGIRGLLEKLIIPFIPDSKMDNHGIKTFPYIIIDSDVAFDGLMQEIVYHELFHYYQNDVLSDDIAQCDLLGKEATANWAAAVNVQINDGTIDFSQWSSLWQNNSDDWFNKKSKNTWGYGLYKAVYHYAENVSDGIQKIVDALYEEDFLASLEANSTVDERKSMMQDLAYHGFANDYAYPALQAKNPNGNISDLTQNSKINNNVANKLSVKYYRIDAGNIKYPAIHFTTSKTEMSATVFLEYKDGTYAMYASSSSNDETIQLPQNDQIAQMYVAISNASFSDGGTYALAIVEGTAPSDTITIEKTVLLDDDNLKIVAESATKEKNVIYISCSYENKTANELALDAGYSIINGYVFDSYIKDYFGKFMPIEPNGKGTFTFNMYGFMGDSRDLNAILKCNAIGKGGVTLYVGHFKDNGKGTTDYKVGPCYFKTADEGKDNTPSSVLQSYGESDSALGFSKLLTYQSINKKIDDVTIMGVAVYSLEDESHVVVAEIENTGDSDRYISFDVEKVNGYSVGIHGAISTIPGCKTIDSISTYEISQSDRMKIYGLSSIGSYTILFEVGSEEYEVNLNFGNDSAINVKQKLIEDSRFTFNYIGSGMRMIEKNKYKEDMDVIFTIETTDGKFSGIELEKSVTVDGKTIDAKWHYPDFDKSYIMLHLEDVDPTTSHSLTFNISYYDSNYQLITKTFDIQI